jgi:hypothetical protein
MRKRAVGSGSITGWHRSLRVFVIALSCVVAMPATAQYYIGPSYLNLPGVEGGKGHPEPYQGWVRSEANYWTKRPARRDPRLAKEITLKFTTSQAPVKGPDVLSLAIAKDDPGLPQLMEKCRRGETLPSATYAESADMMRHPQEDGPRPADLPAFYEYRLKQVSLKCPVVAGAPEQALQLQFQEIEWLNARPESEPRDITATPAILPPATLRGARKVFVVHWLAPLADSRPDQCPQMNSKPTESDYYAFMSPERVAERRAFFADKGGVGPKDMPYRGPDEMNVAMLPGIVADPGFFAPNVDIVQGFDLDGDDGSGAPPPQTRKHRNFLSPDGRRGIDNQLFVVQGCVAGHRRNGVRPMLTNEGRRAGGLAILIEISGIDDQRNDDEVAVTILYSTDLMRRDGTAGVVLPDFTFRVNETPEFSKDFVRFKGRLVDGVVMTDPVERAPLRQSGVWANVKFANARMRIEFKPDGGMTAFLGGYIDWREYVSDVLWNGGTYEKLVGFNSPGIYNAIRRAADGMKDPTTGEFNGISAVYEMEGVPAFIPPSQDEALLAGKFAAARMKPAARSPVKHGKINAGRD